MTKSDLAIELCKRIPNLSKAIAIQVIDNMENVMSASLIKGENIYLRGFGTLSVKPTKQKVARNIASGTSIIIPAGRTVKFKPCKELKNSLNNGTSI